MAMIPTLHPDGRVTVIYTPSHAPVAPEIEEDDGDAICPTCSGSGEGMYDGTRCSSCGGSGVERSKE